MNRIILVLLAVLLLTPLQPALASWSFFAEAEDVEIFVDLESLVKTQESAKLSIMLSFSMGRTVGTKIFSTIDVTEYHCQNLKECQLLFFDISLQLDLIKHF
jgi:hypothetical protein